MVAAMGMAAQSQAALYDITFNGTVANGTKVAASGQIDVVNGAAVSGYLDVSGAVPNSGAYDTLIIGSNLGGGQPFTWDSKVSPSSTPFLNNVNNSGGLLFQSASGAQISFWYNTPAEDQALKGSYYSVPNEYGLWGYYNGTYAPEAYGTATLLAVPEPTSTTKFAGLSALGLLLVTLRRKFSVAG